MPKIEIDLNRMGRGKVKVDGVNMPCFAVDFSANCEEVPTARIELAAVPVRINADNAIVSYGNVDVMCACISKIVKTDDAVRKGFAASVQSALDDYSSKEHKTTLAEAIINRMFGIE